MNKLQKYFDQGFWFYLAISAVAFLLIFSRRPDAVLNPQFWAEDGSVWYQQAYNDGAISALFTSEAGYFQTISRLVAGFSQLFPLEYAPFIFNFSAIAVKISIVVFLLSKRVERLLPDAPTRLFAAFIYLALPHSFETHANLTNVQWHLALLSFLIITSVPAATNRAKIFDYAVVSISALSGPFCILLLPIAAVKYWFERSRTNLILLGILGGGCLIQGISLLTANRPSSAPLGASVKLFIRIVAGHWFFSPIFGEQSFSKAFDRFVWKDGFPAIINLAGFGLLGYAFLKSKIEFRLLIIFSALIVAAALVSPAITKDVPQWTVMWLATVGGRYWLIPMFCFLLSLFWVARNSPNKFVRFVSIFLLLASSIGIIKDWQYAPYKDLEFERHAAEFNQTKSGEEITIPINPDLEMRLKKK